MKVFGFNCIAGYVGGSGLVMANDKAEAVELVNNELKGTWKFVPITEGDLTEAIQPKQVIQLTNGDY